MIHWSRVGTFLLCSAIGIVLWGRVLWLCDEKLSTIRQLVFFAMGRTRLQMGEMRSLILSAIYYAVGLLLALLLTTAFGLPPSQFVFVKVNDVFYVVLGIIGEISLATLLVQIGAIAIGERGPQRFAEVSKIPWIKGLRALPPQIVPLVAAVAGAVEEFFFRGVVLGILAWKLYVPPPLAIVIAGGLFCVQQLLQIRTPFQAVVILSGCISISIVGGLLVVIQGSVVPAILCHASFVVFFMAQNSQRRQQAGAAAGQ